MARPRNSFEASVQGPEATTLWPCECLLTHLQPKCKACQPLINIPRAVSLDRPNSRIDQKLAPSVCINTLLLVYIIKFREFRNSRPARFVECLVKNTINRECLMLNTCATERPKNLPDMA